MKDKPKERASVTVGNGPEALVGRGERLKQGSVTEMNTRDRASSTPFTVGIQGLVYNDPTESLCTLGRRVAAV